MNNSKSHLTYGLFLAALLLLLISDFFSGFFIGIWGAAFLFFSVSFLHEKTRRKSDKQELNKRKLNLLYALISPLFYFTAVFVLYSLGGSPERLTAEFHIVLGLIFAGFIFYHAVYHHKVKEEINRYGENYESGL